MFVTINTDTKKLESTIADPKSEGSLSVRTPKRVSRNIELISKHYTSMSVNLEAVLSPALIKRESLISSNQTNTKNQPKFNVEINPMGLINSQQTPPSRIPSPSISSNNNSNSNILLKFLIHPIRNKSYKY